ncbi:MAG: methionine synthase [Chloroflexi bacterium]|nr:methionine synthase [Chloroflexota bacterium]
MNVSNTNNSLVTTVVGSHAIPGWFWTALNEIDKGNYASTDIKEVYNDAVNIAILDQERSGIDIITDGEMRRSHFVQSFYKKMDGIVQDPPLRLTGIEGYDSPPRYHTTKKVKIPKGLGIIEEFKYLKTQTNKPLKVTCPGPLTLTIHIRPKEGYKDRLELAWDFVDVINSELKELVKLGAEFIQIDEPSYAIIPGSDKDWIELYNACVKDINAKIALHVCFGNFSSRPRGKRNYTWMFPELLNAKSDQLVLEFANREMSEINLWETFNIQKELCAGIVDVKSFYLETPEDVAERIRELLKYVPPEKLSLSPDCGFFQLPRWITYLKLEALVKGTNIVKKELGII